MKKTILFFILVILFIHLDAQVLITTSQMNSINSSQGAFEGQIYKNTETNVFYIGLSAGTLKTIGELNSISANSTLTGNGTTASPLGLAQQGANSGQVLSWNGTSWVPVNAAPANTTVSNTVTAPNSITTTVNGTTGAAVNMVTGVSNTSSNNALSTTVNGVIGANVNIINSISNSFAGGQLTTTVNGVNATPVTLPSGTVTNVIGTSPITVTNGTTTPNISITRNNIDVGTSSSSATNPLVLSGGTNSAVVGGSNATLTVNNTAPLWNANQLRSTNISTTSPTTGQVLRYDGTNWTPYTITNSGNKKLVISAEYAGAVIVPGSGADIHRGDLIGGNTGTIAPYYMNYYEWKGRYTGNQTYQVIVRITLPSDFTSWQTSNPFQFYNMSNTNCNVTLTAYLSTSTTAFYTGSSISNSSWTLSNLTSANLSSWATAGQTASFVFTFSSTNTNVSRIGDIILNYQ